MPRGKQAYIRLYKQDCKRPLTQKEMVNIVLSIWSEFANRLRSHSGLSEFSPTKNENAKNFLRREIYALGLAIQKNQPTTFYPKDLIDKMRLKPTTRTDFSPGVFHALFMCVYEEDDVISRSERWMMTRELKYAKRHGIPPELLCGFLLQSGTRKDIGRKLESGYIEPAFRHLLEK